MKKWLNFLMVFLLSFLLAACDMVDLQELAGAWDTSKTSGFEEDGKAGKEDADKLPDASGKEDTNKQPDISGQEDTNNLPDSLGENNADSDSENHEPELAEDGTYSSKEEVAKYIHLYGHLPSNYITKNEAEKLGWKGGSLEPYAPGKCIGGSRFGNYEGLLPKKDGRFYTECDIDTLGESKRGAKRIVFSNDGLIYYTDDHYESFELLYGEEN